MRKQRLLEFTVTFCEHSFLTFTSKLQQKQVTNNNPAQFAAASQ